MTADRRQEQKEANTARLVRIKADDSLFFRVIEQNTRLRQSGQRYAGACALHGGDSPSGFFVYNTDSGWRWKCSTGDCGGGSILDYVMKRDHLSVWEAADILDTEIGLAPPESWSPRTTGAAAPIASVESLSTDAWNASTQLDQLLPTIGMTGRDWWHARGFSDAAIARFWFGVSTRRVKNPQDVWQTVPSATIPIWQHGQVIALRHRILTPLIPGDKYRPHAPGQGLQLVNADSLTAPSDSVLIVEGELKCYYLCDQGFEDIMPVVATTGGIGSWESIDAQRQRYADTWCPTLARFAHVYVIFDNEYNSRPVAERTAFRHFGRRGHVVFLPGKVDDLLLANPETGMIHLLSAIAKAKTVR